MIRFSPEGAFFHSSIQSLASRSWRLAGNHLNNQNLTKEMNIFSDPKDFKESRYFDFT